MDTKTKNLNSKSYKYCDDINLAVLNHIPFNSLILDVGCGNGALGNELKKKNNYVVGIEKESSALELAKERLNEVCNLDIIDVEKIFKVLSNKQFDVIIFADILEHLYEPLVVLQKYQSLLKPQGKIIISIPNVVVWDVRLKFLFGIFNYTDTGTCDRTHIRFFTLSTTRKLIDEAGLKIIKEDFNPGIFRPFVPLVKKLLKQNSLQEDNPSLILESPLYKAYLRFVYPLEKLICSLCKGLFAFQFVFVAVKK